MKNLITKLKSFAFGTFNENAMNEVEGVIWMFAQYSETLGGIILAGIGGEYKNNEMGIIGGIIALDGLCRFGNAMYKFGARKLTDFDLDHPTIPHAGLIGTIRQ